MSSKYIPPRKRNQVTLGTSGGRGVGRRSLKELEMELKHNNNNNNRNNPLKRFNNSNNSNHSKPITSYHEDEIIKKYHSDCLLWIKTKYPPNENEKNDEEAFRVAFRTNDLRLITKMLDEGYNWTTQTSQKCCLKCNKSIVEWLIDNKELPFDQETFETLIIRASFECTDRAFRTRSGLSWTEESVRSICASINKSGTSYVQDMFINFCDLKNIVMNNTEFQEIVTGMTLRYKPLSVVKFMIKNKIITNFKVTPMIIEGTAMGANIDNLKWVHSQFMNDKSIREKFNEYFTPITLSFVVQNKPDKALPSLDFLNSIGVKGDNDTLGVACISSINEKLHLENLDKLLLLGCPVDSIVWLIAIKNNNIPLLEWIQKKGIPYSEAMDSIAHDFANNKTIDWLQTRDLIA